MYETPNTRIRVVKGDLLDEETEHLVITTCDAFDTATPNIIARNSLQGQALERIYDNNISRLDGDLVAALSLDPPMSPGV